MNQSLNWALLFSAAAFIACSHGSDSGAPKASVSVLQICQKKEFVDSYNYGDSDAKTLQDVVPTALVSQGDTAWVTATASTSSRLQNSLEHGIIRKTSDGGKTWSVIDDSTGPQQKGAENRAIALGANDSIYVAQNIIDGSTTEANLHYSTGNEKTWKDVSYSVPSSDRTQSRSVAVSGDVVYLSVESESGNKKTSTLLKLEEGQLKVVETLPNTEVKQIAGRSDGSVLEVGASLDAKGASTWLIKSTAQSESSFPTTLSDRDKTALNRVYPAFKKPGASSPVLSGSATAVYVDPDETVFVAGTVTDGQTPAWVVRENPDGKIFNVTDVFHYDYGTHKDIVPKAFFNHFGLTALVGGSHDHGGLGYWNVRIRNILTLPKVRAQWAEFSSAMLSNGPDEGSQAVGGFTNSSSQVILVGDTKDATGMRSLKALRLSPCTPKHR